MTDAHHLGERIWTQVQHHFENIMDDIEFVCQRQDVDVHDPIVVEAVRVFLGEDFVEQWEEYVLNE